MSIGVGRDDLVITQAFSFVATANAISYTGAKPIFLDIAVDTWSLCPKNLEKWLYKNTNFRMGKCILNSTSECIKSVVVMNTFGNPGHLLAIKKICKEWGLILIEDAAESLGSFYGNTHTGIIGDIGIYSFNGNKIITTGGGGAVVTSDNNIASRVKHLSTTAKVDSGTFFDHDEIGYNYRMPNINAALGLAQLSKINQFLYQKRLIAYEYMSIFEKTDMSFFKEINGTTSNYWLCSVLCPNKKIRNVLLNDLLDSGIEARPPWKLLHQLPMYNSSLTDKLRITSDIYERAISLPSTPLLAGRNE